MYKKPFVFGVPVQGDYFIGRQLESLRLKENLMNGINTILVSPRRWGKTSLVDKVCSEIKDKDYLIVKMDAFPCRNEYDFYNVFAATVIRTASGRIEDIAENAKGFIERITPSITFSPDKITEYTLSFSLTPKTHTPEEILQLPQVIAERKKRKLIICIDEFQQVAEFPDTIHVQRKLRSVWQHQKDVCYCLYGSRMNMMTKLFNKSSMPFYKFGDVLYLKNIPIENWLPYISSRFAEHGKLIAPDLVQKLCERVEYHSSYIQQLAWYTLLNTERKCTDKTIDYGYQELMEQNTQIFLQQTEHLTSFQMNFLKAIVDGVKKGFGEAEIREKYSLGSSSNINRLKEALIDKELIELSSDGYKISDPVLKQWLKVYFS